MWNAEKVFAGIKESGEVHLRGNPKDLDTILKNMIEYDVEITELKNPKRFKLRARVDLSYLEFWVIHSSEYFTFTKTTFSD